MSHLHRDVCYFIRFFSNLWHKMVSVLCGTGGIHALLERLMRNPTFPELGHSVKLQKHVLLFSRKLIM